MAIKRIVVLASGRGSNFSALVRAIREKKIQNAQIVHLICNKQGAPVLTVAKQEGIASTLLQSADYKKDGKFDRASYEKVLLTKLTNLNPDFICLTGYMLILGGEIIDQFPMRIINIHPSLLPKYKGLHPQRQALLAGETEAGCTVHFVTNDLDGGPIILQKSVPVLSGDTEETLSHRLLPVEHETYVESLRRLCLRT